MVKSKNNYLVPFIIFLAITIILVFIIFSQLSYDEDNEFTEECEDCKPCMQDKAMLFAELTGWYENIEDSSEMFYSYTLYNFGDAEAKNVKVTCKTYNKYENKIAEATELYGNIASVSFEIGEIITANVPTNPSDVYTSLCYVESCDNCEMLRKRLPEFTKILGELGQLNPLSSSQ